MRAGGGIYSEDGLGFPTESAPPNTDTLRQENGMEPSHDVDNCVENVVLCKRRQNSDIDLREANCNVKI